MPTTPVRSAATVLSDGTPQRPRRRSVERHRLHGRRRGRHLHGGQTATIAGVGTLTINADGSYTFTPRQLQRPGAGGHLHLSDGSSSDSSTLTLTVSPVDDPFADANDSVSQCRRHPVRSAAPSTHGTRQCRWSGQPHRLHGSTGMARHLHRRPDGDHCRCRHAHDQRRRQLHLHPGANFNGPVPVATYNLSDGSSSDTLDADARPSARSMTRSADGHRRRQFGPIRLRSAHAATCSARTPTALDGDPVSRSPPSRSPGWPAPSTPARRRPLPVSARSRSTPTAATPSRRRQLRRPGAGGHLHLSDGTARTAATLTLTMGANTPPLATDDVKPVVEDTPAVGNVLTDGTPDSDPEGNPSDGHRLCHRHQRGRHARSLHRGPDGDHRRGGHADHRRQRRLHLHPGGQLQRPGAGGQLHHQRRTRWNRHGSR